MARTAGQSELDTVREIAEKDLFKFAKLLNPTYAYGDIHKKVFRELQYGKSDHQLILLPRAHLKSHCIAVWCVWQITIDPACSIVYLSAGDDLARAQMYAIKGMLTSETYQELWPEMIHPQEGKREQWSAWQINVDHPKRKEMGIRDNTIIVKTVKSNATGLHCSHLVMDDIVVPQNAYTEAGRREVQAAVSQFASIKNPDAVTKAVGTRYHPKDIYHRFLEAKEQVFDEDGNITDEVDLWHVIEEETEDRGDGTGNFLWPRTYHPKTKKWYGFNRQVLAKIKAQYFSLGERAQFFAQYYNQPNDPESQRMDRDVFQYYERAHLREIGGNWHYKDKMLRIYAAVDFAYTDNKTSDYTAIAVIGRSADGCIYILDLDRFRTTKYEQYYQRISDMYLRWGFKKIRVETNAGANLIVEYMRDRIREEGLSFSLDGKNQTTREGAKEQRIAAILEPRYENYDMWHPKDGLTMELEEELMQERPAHDDLKDALAAAVEISRPPAKRSYSSNVTPLKFHPRFGGLVR